jgi:hypothetical protein
MVSAEERRAMLEAECSRAREVTEEMDGLFHKDSHNIVVKGSTHFPTMCEETHCRLPSFVVFSARIML